MSKPYNYLTFSSAMLEKLKDFGELTKYKKGSYIFRDKYPVRSVHVLVSGRASISKMSGTGGQRIIFILDGPELLNEPANDGLSSSTDCIAFDDCLVLAIDMDVFFDLMASDFQLTKVVIDQISHKTRRMYRQLKNAVNTTGVEKRLAAKLWKLCRDYGTDTQDGTLIDIDLTNNSLADLIGIRRETVSRALKVLQDEGLIIYKNRKIFVPNTENLSNFFKSM